MAVAGVDELLTLDSRHCCSAPPSSALHTKIPPLETIVMRVFVQILTDNFAFVPTRRGTVRTLLPLLYGFVWALSSLPVPLACTPVPCAPLKRLGFTPQLSCSEDDQAHLKCLSPSLVHFCALAAVAFWAEERRKAVALRSGCARA